MEAYGDNKTRTLRCSLRICVQCFWSYVLSFKTVTGWRSLVAGRVDDSESALQSDQNKDSVGKNICCLWKAFQRFCKLFSNETLQHPFINETFIALKRQLMLLLISCIYSATARPADNHNAELVQHESACSAHHQYTDNKNNNDVDNKYYVSLSCKMQLGCIFPQRILPESSPRCVE